MSILFHVIGKKGPQHITFLLAANLLFTKCDCTSKFSTKCVALKADTTSSILHEDLGVTPLSKNMEANAELFVMKAFGSHFPTADGISYHQYHHQKVEDFVTSTLSISARLCIKRAYF